MYTHTYTLYTHAYTLYTYIHTLYIVHTSSCGACKIVKRCRHAFGIARYWDIDYAEREETNEEENALTVTDYEINVNTIKYLNITWML